MSSWWRRGGFLVAGVGVVGAVGYAVYSYVNRSTDEVGGGGEDEGVDRLLAGTDMAAQPSNLRHTTATPRRPDTATTTTTTGQTGDSGSATQPTLEAGEVVVARIEEDRVDGDGPPPSAATAAGTATTALTAAVTGGQGVEGSQFLVLASLIMLLCVAYILVTFVTGDDVDATTGGAGLGPEWTNRLVWMVVGGAVTMGAPNFGSSGLSLLTNGDSESENGQVVKLPSGSRPRGRLPSSSPAGAGAGSASNKPSEGDELVEFSPGGASDPVDGSDDGPVVGVEETKSEAPPSTTSSSSSSAAAATASSSSSSSSSIHPKISEADELVNDKKIAAAESVLTELTSMPSLPPDVRAAALWRLARLCSMKGSGKSKEQRQALAQKGVEYVMASLKLVEACSDAHKWASILLAHSAKSTKESIQNAYRIRDHAKRAIDLNPADSIPYHVMGEWCTAVAGISWVNRRVAAALFGSPPESSYEEALGFYIKSETADPGRYRTNVLRIAQTLIQLGRKADAREWVVKCQGMPSGDGDDRDLDTQLKKAASSV